MKNFLLFYLLFAFTASADTKIELALETEVDSILSIERIGDKKKLDIFKDAEAEFRILYNGLQNIKVTFESKNQWKLLNESNRLNNKPSDSKSQQFIEYECLVNDNSINNNHYIVDNNEFNNGVYDFQIKLKPKVEAVACVPGKYTDSLTITISPEQ